jgi:hypothetical protein
MLSSLTVPDTAADKCTPVVRQSSVLIVRIAEVYKSPILQTVIQFWFAVMARREILLSMLPIKPVVVISTLMYYEIYFRNNITCNLLI